MAVPGSFVTHPLRSDVYNFKTLLLDSRGVDGPRSSNLIVVTLSSLKPFVFNGLKRHCPSRTTLKPKTPESKKSGQGYRSLAGHAQRLVLFLAGLRYCLRLLVSVLSII